MERSFQRPSMRASRNWATFRSSGARSTLQTMRTSGIGSSHSWAISNRELVK